MPLKNLSTPIKIAISISLIVFIAPFAYYYLPSKYWSHERSISELKSHYFKNEAIFNSFVKDIDIEFEKDKNKHDKDMLRYQVKNLSKSKIEYYKNNREPGDEDFFADIERSIKFDHQLDKLKVTGAKRSRSGLMMMSLLNDSGLYSYIYSKTEIEEYGGVVLLNEEKIDFGNCFGEYGAATLTFSSTVSDQVETNSDY